MRHKHIIFFIICVVLFPIVITANESDPNESKSNQSEFAIYPQFSFGDETGFNGGPISFYRFFIKNPESVADRSKIQLQAVYSEKKQLEMRSLNELYFPGKIYSLIADIKYKYWPSEFYGFGNNINTDKYENYTPREYFVKMTLRREFTEKYFGLILYDLSYQKIVENDDDGILKNKDIPGSEPYLVSGLGVGLGRDTRNLKNYPSQGSYASISVLRFQDFLGSDYNFTRYQLDLRSYFSITGKQILAGQILGVKIDNVAPFNEIGHLSEGLRTISTNTYIDNIMFASRVEYRYFPWTKKYFDRIGFVAFGGIGNVFNSFEDISTNDMNYNYGGGLRISLFTKDKFNLRIDYGQNKDSSSISIGAGEEF